MNVIKFQNVNPYTSGRLYYLLGIPRCGKSSFANKWVRYEDKQTIDELEGVYTSYVYELYNPRVILCADSFRYALTGEVYEKEAEAAIYTMVDYAAKALLLTGHDVLMDETSSTKATLRRYYRLDINATGIWIDTPKEVCIERAKNLKQDYLIPVIERISKQLDKLRPIYNQVVAEIRQELQNG
jgi:predicted kinase